MAWIKISTCLWSGSYSQPSGVYADDLVEYSCFSILPLTLSDDLCFDLESALELVLEPPDVLAIANCDEVISVHQNDQTTLLVVIYARLYLDWSALFLFMKDLTSSWKFAAASRVQ